MKTRFSLHVFIISISFLVFSSSAQNFEEKVNMVMDQYMKLDQFSGTILVARNGNIIYSNAFGEANKDYHIKNSMDTKFNIGSIGKTFTAIAILQLVEQKKLQLNESASLYLKNFPACLPLVRPPYLFFFQFLLA